MSTVLRWLVDHGVERGDDVAVALHPGVGIGVSIGSTELAVDVVDPIDDVQAIESAIGPRWVWWNRTVANHLAERRLTVARSWDVLTVHRLLAGRWRTSLGGVWASLHGLPLDSLPTMGQLDLLGAHGDEGDRNDPVQPDGHLRPEWISEGWRRDPDRLAAWARLARRAAELQRAEITARPDAQRLLSTAHSESAAEFLCAELATEGLPIDTATATSIIEDAVGPRPANEQEAEARRRQRDAAVLEHAGPGPALDLRNPADVKTLLRRVSVDVPDTRAWRLEQHRDDHPVVPALLTWRKAERISTTYGYRWLDEHVVDGRLRGEWSSSDGAAGRMTASAGLHNLPAELRPAVAAEPGQAFVRADLGQIEPRVLAAVSGDENLIAATLDADLYQPVADRLRVARDIAKVAVLGAMYGSTTGESAHALRGLEREYPVAMGYLEAAAEHGRAGESVRTIGGRTVRMWVDDSVEGDIDRARRVAAARGRFARNAVVQGAAAEFFKVWAILVRRDALPLGGRIVLCLHDELIVHAPVDTAPAVAEAFDTALAEAAYRWSPSTDVRFVADVSIIGRWSEAK